MTKKKEQKSINKEIDTKSSKNKELILEIEKLKQEKNKLEKKLKEQEEITKNTQLQYITLKNDFNLFTKRVKENEKKLKDDIFENIILKILPLIEMIMLSYDNLPKEFKSHKWTEWLSILHKKIIWFLKDFNIEIIPTIWETVDETKHEVIWTKPDSKNKWKIVVEVKKWYIRKYPNGDKILQPAKVLIW